MSRIDEALKRITEERIVDSWDTSSLRSETSQFADGAVLEHYPCESQTRVDRGAHLKRQAGNLAAVVHVPQPQVPPRERSVIPALEGKLVSSREVSPAAVEHYGRLAAALEEIQARSLSAPHAQGERGLRTLLVTSALRREGRTLTAINLALTLSETYGRHVLLIDADLGRASTGEVLGVSNETGLGDFLGSDVRDLPLTKISRLLSVLPAGHSHAHGIGGLASHRMRAVLDECTARFDWVLLDAPPVNMLPDRQRAPHLTRAVLFVIRSVSTPHAAVDRAIARIGRGCIVGTVLNRVEPHTLSAAGY